MDAGTQALVLRPDVVATVLPDGAVLLDLETKFFFHLNPTAWAIVQLFETGADRRTVTDAYEGAGPIVQYLVAENLAVPTDTAAAATTPPPFDGPWVPPRIEKQPEPLQRVMVSAFDPSLPLAE